MGYLEDAIKGGYKSVDLKSNGKGNGYIYLLTK